MRNEMLITVLCLVSFSCASRDCKDTLHIGDDYSQLCKYILENGGSRYLCDHMETRDRGHICLNAGDLDSLNILLSISVDRDKIAKVNVFDSIELARFKLETLFDIGSISWKPPSDYKLIISGKDRYIHIGTNLAHVKTMLNDDYVLTNYSKSDIPELLNKIRAVNTQIRIQDAERAKSGDIYKLKYANGAEYALIFYPIYSSEELLTAIYNTKYKSDDPDRIVRYEVLIFQ